MNLKKLVMTIVGAAVAVIGVGASNSAHAATDYLSTSTGQVGTVDTSTGVFTPIINNDPVFTDIALSSTNQLFGNTFTQLYSINTTTGVPSLIGNLGTSLNALGFSVNDVLYGAGSSNFYTINTSTGAASLVANIPNFTSSGDVVYDSANNRFLATSSTGIGQGTGDDLFSITPTGIATDIGKVGFSNVFGLVFNGGTLYGYTSDNQQIVVNPITGAGTFNKKLTGNNGSIFGAANAPSQGSTISVPEPSSTLSILAFGVIGIGCLLKRQYKKAAI